MSFASPLGLGITSEGEYFDIEITEEVTSKEGVARMNATSVEGIEVVSFRQIPSDKKNLGMTILAGATYLVSFAGAKEAVFKIGDLEELVGFFLQQSEINILKETKKSANVVNIRPFIYEMVVKEDGVIKMTLAAGSKVNLKPDLVMKAFCSYVGVEYQEYSYHYHRVEMYADVGGEGDVSLVSLEDLGEEIE
jgi:radical SAM-linked protein